MACVFKLCTAGANLRCGRFAMSEHAVTGHVRTHHDGWEFADVVTRRDALMRRPWMTRARQSTKTVADRTYHRQELDGLLAEYLGSQDDSKPGTEPAQTERENARHEIESFLTWLDWRNDPECHDKAKG
jgi:hypothetical protein